VLLFAGLGISVLIWLLLPTKSFRRTLFNHFISKVIHDLFSFRREVLANGPRFRQLRFSYYLPNLLLRMRRNGQNCTSGHIFNRTFEIPMSCSLFEYEFWWRFRRVLYVF